MRATAATIVIALAILLTACGGDSDPEPEPDLRDEAILSACETSARTLETAMAAHLALEGTPATDSASLVDAGLIRPDATRFHEVTDGEVVLTDEGRDAGCPAP